MGPGDRQCSPRSHRPLPPPGRRVGAPPPRQGAGGGVPPRPRPPGGVGGRPPMAQGYRREGRPRQGPPCLHMDSGFSGIPSTALLKADPFLGIWGIPVYFLAFFYRFVSALKSILSSLLSRRLRAAIKMPDCCLFIAFVPWW